MLKITEGGASVMCGIMEKYMAEAAKEADEKANIREAADMRML